MLERQSLRRRRRRRRKAFLYHSPSRQSGGRSQASESACEPRSFKVLGSLSLVRSFDSVEKKKKKKHCIVVAARHSKDSIITQTQRCCMYTTSPKNRLRKLQRRAKTPTTQAASRVRLNEVSGPSSTQTVVFFKASPAISTHLYTPSPFPPARPDSSRSSEPRAPRPTVPAASNHEYTTTIMTHVRRRMCYQLSSYPASDRVWVNAADE
ncbi:hypothetical protein IWX48DRAFT_132605 [Phyllosticta citricarpa]